MKKLSIAYFGTPYFSAVLLEKILNDKKIPIDIKLVVTQPDKPVGREQILTASPVKSTAKKYGVEVYDSKVESLKSKLSNFDMAFLYAYGKIIPNEILNIPRQGFLNTHPSLLPLYRGASPVAYPLILGDKKTGVTLIKLDEEVDHGPVIAQEEIAIEKNDRRPDLEVKLTDLAFKMFKQLITRPVYLREQNHSIATFTRLLSKNDGFVPLENLKKATNEEPIFYKELPGIIREYLEKHPPVDLHEKIKAPLKSSHIFYDLFRGFYPWPGIWTKVKINGAEKRLKITDVDINQDKLIVKKVQLEGKKEVDFETFNRAYKIF